MRLTRKVVVLLSCMLLSCGSRVIGEEHESEPLHLALISVERVSRTAVDVHLRISNQSSIALFVEGARIGKPIIASLFLEHADVQGGWHIVAPCQDVAVGILLLKPKVSVDVERALTDPVEGTCKERKLPGSGSFRFRLVYFSKKKQAKAFEKAFDFNQLELNDYSFVTSVSFVLPS